MADWESQKIEVWYHRVLQLRQSVTFHAARSRGLMWMLNLWPTGSTRYSSLLFIRTTAQADSVLCFDPSVYIFTGIKNSFRVSVTWILIRLLAGFVLCHRPLELISWTYYGYHPLTNRAFARKTSEAREIFTKLIGALKGYSEWAWDAHRTFVLWHLEKFTVREVSPVSQSMSWKSRNNRQHIGVCYVKSCDIGLPSQSLPMVYIYAC